MIINLVFFVISVISSNRIVGREGEGGTLCQKLGILVPGIWYVACVKVLSVEWR